MNAEQSAPSVAGRPFAAFAAPTFVFLWSTGFIGAKLGLPYAEPMTFLSLRFAMASLILAVWLAATGGLRTGLLPRREHFGLSALIGVLVHALYLGAVFVAIDIGVEAGLTALIIGLQPLVMAVIAWRFLGERLRKIQVLGFALGLLGAGTVIVRKLSDGFGSIEGVAICGVGLLAISIGSIVQKRYGGDIPMRRGAVVQYAAAAALLGAVAFAVETREIDWTLNFVFAFGWATIVLSIGAVLLLYYLLAHGAASEVASLFFLVPPSTAVIAWAMFGETLGAIEIAGVALSAFGVWLVLRPVDAERSQ